MEDKIRSLQNARIKVVVRLLRDAAARRESGLTVVEGSREVARAVESGWTPEEVYVCFEQADETAQALVTDAERRGIRVFRCSTDAFEKMSYRENPDGLLAVGTITEKMEKPGNLGALLRTADGAGVDAVIVCDPATDLGNPNLIRASIGTVFYLPIALAASEDAVRWLKERSVRIVTTEPGAELLHTAADLTGSVAIVVGAEDAGLSSAWTSHADARVRIPMLGRNDSLNVSAAAAILLYEAVRQRG
jgi:TrmH family RNA methyltransferase